MAVTIIVQRWTGHGWVASQRDIPDRIRDNLDANYNPRHVPAIIYDVLIASDMVTIVCDAGDYDEYWWFTLD